MVTSEPSRRLHSVLTTASCAAAGAVAGMGVLVLLGWALDVEFLKSLLHPNRVAMNPLTAVCFVLAGAALWLSRRAEPWPRRDGEDGRPSPPGRKQRTLWGATLLAGVVAASAMVKLSDFLPGGGADLRIDRLLFRARLGENEMAPDTAVAFVLVALAMLTLDARNPRLRWLSTAFTLSAASVALLALTGYLYNVLSLYQVRGYIPMALNTAIAFGTLCVGILAARPRREPVATAVSDTLGGMMARRLIPTAFLVPLLIGWLRMHGQRRGWYENETGLALFVLANILVFNGLIWWCARVLHASDTRHRRSEQELRQSEQRHRAVMEQAAEGIYLVDLESKRIIESNAALDRLLGYGRGESTNCLVYDFVDDAREKVDARLRQLSDGSATLHGERDYRRKDGSTVEVEVSASVIEYGGRRVACTVVHDITQRKRAQRELQETNRLLAETADSERAAHEQLKQAQSQLVQSEKLASLGQMVAGVAHEINNPLAFVSNNVAVLERDTRSLCEILALYARAEPAIARDDPALAAAIADLADRVDLQYTTSNLPELLSRSRDGLKRIQQIVCDLRDFARLDESDRHEVDLNDGIVSTVNIIAGRARSKRVVIQQRLGTLPHVSCHPAKINQVVMNLLANAIDACPVGGRVEIASRLNGSGVEIEVSDNGPGIPPDIAGRIFDPFFTTKPVGEGTGLGLSISYGIVRDHGGSMDVRSSPGEGATFTVRLPLQTPNF